MATAKDLKLHTTLIRKTTTGLRTAIAQAKSSNIYGDKQILNHADVDRLEKAIEILIQLGGRTDVLAKQAAKQEKQIQADETRALAAIKVAMAQTQWACNTLLDKIAFVYAFEFDGKGSLLRALELPVGLRAGYEREAEFMFKMAKNDFQDYVSYRAARLPNGISGVEEILCNDLKRLEEYKTKPDVMIIAQEWQQRIDQDNIRLAEAKGA